MNSLQPLKLLLPALIPSWNFFDIISPSPRIEYSLLYSEEDKPLNWTEFRPRPIQFSLRETLKNTIWNPKWNETLFLVSCAERIIENYTQHSENEIFKRIEKDLLQRNETTDKIFLQFRLLFIHRQGINLKSEVLFISQIHKLSEDKR